MFATKGEGVDETEIPKVRANTRMKMREAEGRVCAEVLKTRTNSRRESVCLTTTGKVRKVHS